MSSLSHHGIKGQRWGVRRFQNPDGTRTSAGKKRYSVEAVDVDSSRKEIKKLVSDFSKKDKEFFFGEEDWYRDYDSNGDRVAKRFVIKEGKNIVAFIDAERGNHYYSNESLNVVVGTAQSARGKGYASILSKTMVDWYEAEGYKDANMLEWNANKDNIGSRKAAEKAGFKEVLGDEDVGYRYSKNAKKELDELSKARMRVKAIDKEVSDKINSDFKKTKLSKISPNTTITPYGEGETGWNSELGFYKSMVVDHYATKWAKKNHAEDIAKYNKATSDWDSAYSKFDKKRRAKHTSIGGTMYIEGNALILGDSSYLEHHGIRGQRWGVRRFQNRDGSLTNAGRKRLGYATKGAVQTVGKAFKAGVKAGGNAIKAVKAHHEKKEAEKLEKKKEKASKTRLGVMANKDLFTNEEIRKLNERFKLEDEMKMATLQKGVEIAKAVGTIAQNVGTVAKTYEDVTGQSLSPIKRKAAEEKARQDKEDRERRIAREDAEEARKAAKEERDIAIHEQTLRKAIAAADTQEFTAQKTKAEADSSVLDAIKKGQDFNGGTDATGQSWVEKAKSGGKNPFDDMIANRDPEYAQIRKEHDEKVARKERIAELERREKEREAEKAAAKKQSAPQQKQGGGDDDALFSQKGSLPIDKDRYRNNRAMEKAKQVKEDAAEERAKKQDEKAAKATIDDMMEARRQFTDSARANSNGAFDRETAANYIKGKAKELPSKLNPINAIAKKITNKALKEEEDNARKTLEDEYKKASRSQGRDEANYTMYYNRVNALQSQGYSERQAKKVADTENPFSSKRNRRFEYNEKVGEIETTHRKNAKEINKANKELTDYYYKLVNGPGYEPGSPKREALDRKYAQKRGELERLEKDNNEMLDREKKKAKKILEHSLSIQNGVLFIDSSYGLAHHGVKGQRWGVSGTRMRSKKIAKYENMLKQPDMEEEMYHVENGTLFINAGEPYLEHHGVLGMKWGKHLRAGKGPADSAAGGGGGEDDEKLKEMAKKAGMSVAEYKQKFASKIGGAASKVGSAVYDAAGGSHKKNAEGWRKMAREESNAARASEKSAHENSARAASQDRKYGSGGDVYRRAAESDKENAEIHRSNAKGRSERAASEQAAYEKSLAGRYDKMKAGGAKKTKKAVNELSTKVTAAKKRLKDVPGELYGSKHREDFERNARLHENNRKSMHAQAKAAWEGYGESRTAAQRDNWKRYAEYDRQAKASGNMFVKRERSKQAYDNSLASKVDSVKRKARLTQDKAKSKISDAVDAAKKTSDDVKSTVRSKTGIGVKKDINRNARLAEGQQKRAHELTKQVYSAKNKDDWARAYSESNKESFKALDNEYKVKKDAKSYPKSIAGRVESTKRKARLTKDRLKSTLGKSKQRKQLSTVGPKAKKQISNARDDVEKASRSNENAYKHAKAVYRQTGSDSDAYKQAIKRSGTTLQRYIDSKKLLEKKKRAKHLDETGAIYTEGTRLVVNSKWG